MAIASTRSAGTDRRYCPHWGSNPGTAGFCTARVKQQWYSEQQGAVARTIRAHPTSTNRIIHEHTTMRTTQQAPTCQSWHTLSRTSLRRRKPCSLSDTEGDRRAVTHAWNTRNRSLSRAVSGSTVAAGVAAPAPAPAPAHHDEEGRRGNGLPVKRAECTADGPID
jgi:hypothetical protein